MFEKINFMDTAFIIPFQESNNENRSQSLALTLKYLLSNFNTNIYLIESGADKYISKIKPFLNAMDINCENIKYFQDKNYYEFFPKTKLLNDLIVNVKEEYVVMNDSDIILPIQSYLNAKFLLEQGTDLVIPYTNKRNYYVDLDTQIFLFDSKYLLNTEEIINNISPLKTWDEDQPGPQGGIHFHKYQSYINCFMENENFYGYGPEDVEKVQRFKRLGFNVKRTNGMIFHFKHEKDYLYTKKNNIENDLLMQKLSGFTNLELIDYYKKQKYYKKRLKEIENRK